MFITKIFICKKEMEEAPPIVFISYSWDSEQHKEWILNLATDLRKAYGVDVLLDQYDLDAGKGLTRFMERSLETATKVLVILTPEYKQKATQEKGGVGYEHTIISAELFRLQADNDKFIPVLRSGNTELSAPGYLQSLVYHPMTDDDQYESDLYKLARIIHNKPMVERPPLGPKPDFEKLPVKDPILEAALKRKASIDAEYKRIAFLNSEAGVDASRQEVHDMFRSIVDKAESYQKATDLFFRADTDYEELGLRGEGGSGVYMRWQYSVRNRTSSNILLVKFYEKFPFMWSNGRFTSHEPNSATASRVEYVFDVSLDMKTNGWRQVDTETTLTSVLLESTLFKWVLTRITEYKDREIRKQRN